jgi:hypothetical protein
MRHIRCPEEWRPGTDGEVGLFVAGGITGCEDWHTPFIELLRPCEKLAVLNPRRIDFDTNDPQMAKDQIAWEFRHFARADAASFWFPPETLCPITLFELGGCLHRVNSAGEPMRVFVGVHPDYKRRIDLEEQIPLARPDVKINYTIRELAEDVRKWAGRAG